MIYIDDTYYDKSYFERCNDLFERNEILRDCSHKRIAVCLHDPALWIALCLYIKSNDGSVLPLPVNTPKEAARHRAEKGLCHFLLHSNDMGSEGALGSIEAVVNRENDEEPVIVQMSSGTTGEPKYIHRSWCSIDNEIENYVVHFSEANEMTPIVACPVSHSYGLICGVLVALKRDHKPLIIQNLNPKYIIRKLYEVDKPLLYSSPTLIAAISMLVKEEKPIHAVMTSGTLMQAGWFDNVRKKVKHLYQQYGCSEVGCIALAKDVNSVSDVGVPLPHLQVDAGSEVGAPSEILVKVPSGETIRTRDLGHFDGKGSLHFVSRLDDMINVSGLNVYPVEVEDVVLQIPEIEDAVIFKRQHTFGNHQVCLNYVSDIELEESRIREWCRKKLAPHQVPLSISHVESIQKLPNGKISRKNLA